MRGRRTRGLSSPGPFSVLDGGLARQMDLCNDFADEGLEFGWGWRDLKGFAKHGFGLVEERGVFAEEGDEGLVGVEFVAEFGVHLDAGVGGDWIAWLGSPRSKALDGPPYLLAVHGREVAAL